MKWKQVRQIATAESHRKLRGNVSIILSLYSVIFYQSFDMFYQRIGEGITSVIFKLSGGN